MKDILEEFIDKICSTCKGKCDKGITFVLGEEKTVRCVDYVKDESKIEKKEKVLYPTANKTRLVIKDLV